MAKFSRDLDYEYALSLQKQFESEDKEKSAKRTVMAPVMKNDKIDLADPHLELIDPTPNVHALFMQFDANFFWKKLGGVVVRWSKRMYSCAGICRYQGRGGMCDIALSEPLLKLRPRKDLIETLLHEMIHAYLFLTNNDRDRDGHGPNFHEHMYRINKAANVNITVYHTFIDEVRLYQTHWWRCNGACQAWKPFFGTIRRSVNRAPGPNDFWWQQHQQQCGGLFIKIKEPEKKKRATPASKKENIPNRSPDITKFFIPSDNPGPSKSGIAATSTPNKSVLDTVRNHWATKFPNQSPKPETKKPNEITNYIPTYKRLENDDREKILKDIYGDDFKLTKEHIKKEVQPLVDLTNAVNCPCCSSQVAADEINTHLDVCLGSDNPSTGRSNKRELSPIKLEEDNRKKVKTSQEEFSQCPVCNETIPKNRDEHLEECVSKFFTECDNIPMKNNDETISLSSDDDIDESQELNTTGTKFPCPCCLQMVEQQSMDRHLDECLS